MFLRQFSHVTIIQHCDPTLRNTPGISGETRSREHDPRVNCEQLRMSCAQVAGKLLPGALWLRDTTGLQGNCAKHLKSHTLLLLLHMQREAPFKGEANKVERFLAPKSGAAEGGRPQERGSGPAKSRRRWPHISSDRLHWRAKEFSDVRRNLTFPGHRSPIYNGYR